MSSSGRRSLFGWALMQAQHYRAAGLGVRGILLFAWAKLSGHQPLFRVRVPGIGHPVAVRIGTTDVSVLRQVLVECQYDVALPSAPRRIVDAGANIGLAAVFFANKFPGAEIVALEPDESNFRVLEENAKPYPNIHAIQAALWNADGEILLFDPGTGHHGFQTSDAQSGNLRSRGHVLSFTVDTLMKRMGWAGIDLLKIDIEGAEREVFESSHSWIASVGACMAEVHDHIKPGCGSAFERATADFAGRTTKGESLVAWRA